MEVKKDQHFMSDKKVLERMVSLSGVGSEDTVLEIGAGAGYLTRLLAGKAKKVIAVEIDESLKKTISRELDDFSNVEIVFGNGLGYLESRPVFDVLVSNIPYSISEPLFQKLFGMEFRSAIIAVPKKFAYRLIAKKGDELYSRLSLMASIFFDIKILDEIPKEAFLPKPKTNSVVVQLLPKPDSLLKMILSKPKQKLKNSLVESLCSMGATTKNQAREIIKDAIPINILDKKLREINIKELENIINSIDSLAED